MHGDSKVYRAIISTKHNQRQQCTSCEPTTTFNVTFSSAVSAGSTEQMQDQDHQDLIGCLKQRLRVANIGYGDKTLVESLQVLQCVRHTTRRTCMTTSTKHHHTASAHTGHQLSAAATAATACQAHQAHQAHNLCHEIDAKMKHADLLLKWVSSIIQGQINANCIRPSKCRTTGVKSL